MYTALLQVIIYQLVKYERDPTKNGREMYRERGRSPSFPATNMLVSALLQVTIYQLVKYERDPIKNGREINRNVFQLVEKKKNNKK